MRTVAAVDANTPLKTSGYSIGNSRAGNYLAGRFAHKRHDYGTAAEFLSHALESGMVNTTLLRRAFLVSLAGGRMAEAEQIARQIAESDPGAPLATITLVVADIRAERLAAAEERLKGVKRRGLSTFLTPLLRAWILVGRGDVEAALAALQPISTISGFAVLHDLHAGLLNDAAGRLEEAEKQYLQAANRARRTTLRIVQALGSLYERTGRPDRAKTLYDGYMGENPDSQVLLPAIRRLETGAPAPKLTADVREGAAEAFFNVASTLTQENAVELALIYGRLALVLRPDLDLAKMLIGGIFESLDRQAEAIDVYSAVGPKSPLGWSARLRMASSLDAMGREEEAIDQLRQMADDEKDRAEALINLGDLLRAKKRFAESVDAYDAAFRRLGDLDSRHWTLLYSRGISLERSKQWDRAEKDFIRALELKPDQPYVLNYLGYSWVDQGINLDRARKMIERAVELRPNDGYIVDSLGWVQFRLGEYGEAVRQLERAVELRPQDPTINDHLGDAYWRVGRAVEARFQWHRALTLDPEQDQIATIRKKITEGLSAAPREKGS